MTSDRFVVVSGPCDGRCSFCDRGVGGRLHGDRPLSDEADLRALIREAAGAGRVTFGGDEPLAHPRLPEAVRLARAGGAREVWLMTSGVRLAQPGLARALAESGARGVVLPLYGPDARTHDAVVGIDGAFDGLRRGAERARDAGLVVRAQSLVLRSNLATLRETDALCRRWTGIGLEQAGHVLPRGPDLEDYRSHAPPYAEVVSSLDGSGIPLGRFPLCVARRSNPAARGTAPGLNPDDVRAFPEVCAGCSLRPRCQGAPVAMLDLFGPGDLLPD